jgi:hypothetical protein
MVLWPPGIRTSVQKHLCTGIELWRPLKYSYLQRNMEAALRREEKEREGSRRILGSPGGRRRCRFGRRSADGGGIDGGSGG